jgi:hypothetical protein
MADPAILSGDRRHNPNKGRSIKALRVEQEAFLRATLEATTDDCIIWPWARCKGYAVKHTGFTAEFSTIISNAFCQIKKGPPPSPAHEAAHSCGKGRAGCINPNHLSWATHQENMNDKRLHGTQPKGERHFKARVSNEAASEIRRLSRNGSTQIEIAAMFGISQSTTSRIVNRKTYRVD